MQAERPGGGTPSLFDARDTGPRCEYRLTVQCTCPSDETADSYAMTVSARRMIPVEAILAAVAEETREPRYQEDITVAVAKRLRARVVTVGCHYGVEAECEARG